MLVNDDNILLSVINTLLRDKYKNLDDLCADKELNKIEIMERLKKIDYSYDAKTNQFK